MYFNLIVDSLQRAIPGLSAVYVFGSQATSGAGPESDLDLAILADVQLLVEKMDQLQAEVHALKARSESQ